MTPARSQLGVLGLLLASWSVNAESIPARVIGVTDGDTLTVLTADRQQIKVRLAGIDAPGRKQPFGTAAKQALSNLAYGRDAIIAATKEDRYGRTIGKVTVDGRDVNLEMVSRGYAWWYRKYANEQGPEDRRSMRLRRGPPERFGEAAGRSPGRCPVGVAD